MRLCAGASLPPILTILDWACRHSTQEIEAWFIKRTELFGTANGRLEQNTRESSRLAAGRGRLRTVL